MERDWNTQTAGAKLEISTHTLTWSVTINAQSKHAISINFNSHAHVERDDKLTTNEIAFFHFNSHAHVERDNCHVLFTCYLVCISTHTLTWSVTALKFYNDKTTLNFNSHAHVERDVFPCAFVVYLCISTHTLTWSVTTLATIICQSIIFQLTRSRGA